MFKRRAFAYSFIFLVIFQLFSPWMLNVSSDGIGINKNVAEAATERKEIAKANSDAFIIVTGLTDKQNITISTFTDPNHRINDLNITFIRDKSGTPDAGCPAEKTILATVENLYSVTPTSKGLTGFHSTYTDNNLYLESSYKIDLPEKSTFNSKCVEEGHYEFMYIVEDTNQKTDGARTEKTTTGEAVEKIWGKRTKNINFLSVQGYKENNFDASWGYLETTKRVDGNYPCYHVELKTNILGIDENELIASNKSADNPVPISSVKYLQSPNSNFTFYERSCSTSVDKTIFKPSKSGGYTIDFINKEYSNASISFKLPIVGKIHSFGILSDENNTDSTKKASCVADYCLKDFSVTPLEELSKKDDKIYVQAKVSIFLSDGNVKKFSPFSDLNNNDIADSEDDPNDWTSFLADDGKSVDTRSAKDGNGFYLIWGTEQDLKIDNANGEINLNEYLFGEKMKPSPIISGKSGMAFEIPIGPVEFGKTYYFKLYGKDRGEDLFDLQNSGYSVQTSKKIDKNITDITQESRDGILLEEGDELTSLPWMPKCEADSPSTWFTGCMVQAFYYLIFVPTAELLAIAGSIMDWVLEYSISPGVYKVGYIVDGWRFIRDVCNLFFIFMLIYLAFKIILGVGHNAKQMVVNTLIIATVINFSYPLTTVIIDISNVTARQLYYNSFNKKDENSGKPVGLSTMVAAGFSPQKLIAGADGQSGLTNDQRENNKGTIFMIILMGVLFNIIGIIVFLKVALQFIYRILGLVFAIILSPLALFSYSLDEKQRGKLSMVGFDQWMSGLLSDAFKAPVFLFFILILALFVGSKPFSGLFNEATTGLDWWMSLIIPFMMIVGFMFLIVKVTKSMSSGLADMAGSYLMKGVGAVAGVAMGGAALAGSGLIGKAATKFAGSSMGQRIMDRAAGGTGVSGWVARQQAKLIRKTQSGSFDLRQTGLGNAVSKEAGMNFNLAAGAIGLGTASAVGGYVGTVERRNKKREEFVQMLEWNKKLAQELDSKKKSKEDEIKNKETEAKDIKARADNADRELKDSEKIKKDADEVVSELEKIEDLLAKRDDLIADGKSTNEIDVQIGRVEAKITNGAGGLISTVGNTKTTTAQFATDKNAALANKTNAKTDRDGKQTVYNTARDELKVNDEEIRALNKEIATLTKAIENIKNNRKNMYAHRIRNKSGHIYRKSTYDKNKDGSNRPLTAEEQRAFGVGTAHDISDQMRNIVTSVDDHSHETNDAFIRNRIAINTGLGLLAGAFTGGIGAIVAGVATGGVVGIARSYRPDNEHYGVPHDKDEWHPHSEDTYRPGGTSGGSKPAKPSGDGGAHH